MSIEQKVNHLIENYGITPAESWIIAIEWDRNETVKKWMTEGEIESIPIVESGDVTINAERKVTTQSKSIASVKEEYFIQDLPEQTKAIYRQLPKTFETSEGVEIAKNNGMHERVFKRLLNDRTLFVKIKRGVYRKDID